MTTDTPTTPDGAAPSEGPMDIEALMRAAIMGDSGSEGDSAPAPDESADDAGKADEAEEEGSKETEESGKDDDSADDDTNDDDANAQDLIKDPKALLKVHEEVKAERTKLKEKLKELEAQLAEPEVPAVALTPTLRNPLSNVVTEKGLAEAEAYWQKELDWCLANLEGGDRPAAAGSDAEEWDAPRVREHLTLARRVLGKELHSRAKFLTEYRASVARAAEAFPFLDKAHPLFAEVEQFTDGLVKAVPELSQTPNWLETVSDAYLGRMVRSGKYGASVGKDGKVSLVKLGSGKAAPVMAKKPQTTPRATAPAGKKADPKTSNEDAVNAAFRAGDIETANRLMVQGILPAKAAA